MNIPLKKEEEKYVDYFKRVLDDPFAEGLLKSFYCVALQKQKEDKEAEFVVKRYANSSSMLVNYVKIYENMYTVLTKSKDSDECVYYLLWIDGDNTFMLRDLGFESYVECLVYAAAIIERKCDNREVDNSMVRAAVKLIKG